MKRWLGLIPFMAALPVALALPPPRETLALFLGFAISALAYALRSAVTLSGLRRRD